MYGFSNLAYYSRLNRKNKDLLIIRYTFVTYNFNKKTTIYMVNMHKHVQNTVIKKFFYLAEISLFLFKLQKYYKVFRLY